MPSRPPNDSPESRAGSGPGAAEPVKTGVFIDRLEALRGVAAMMVAAGHALLVAPVSGWRETLVKVLVLVFNGRAAVTIFFVLSGFVLGLSLRRSSESFGRGTFRFWIRRWFRIYPAFLASTTVIVGYLLLASNFSIGSNLPSWFWGVYGFYREPVGFARVVSNLTFRDYSLNMVTWTLQVEMICSMLLPFLHWVACRLSLRQCVVLLALLPLLGIYWKNSAGGGYLYMFFLGYLLPAVGPPLLAALRQDRKRTARVIAGAIFLLLFARMYHGGPDLKTKVGFLFEALGAAAFIGALVYGPDFRIFKVLDHPIVRFYGRISYSFYLWHSFCLFLVAETMLGFIPEWTVRNDPIVCDGLLFLISASVATAVSYASYKTIELPFIRISKTVCRRFHRPVAGL